MTARGNTGPESRRTDGLRADRIEGSGQQGSDGLVLMVAMVAIAAVLVLLWT